MAHDRLIASEETLETEEDDEGSIISPTIFEEENTEIHQW